jgi:hypothetical protein
MWNLQVLPTDQTSRQTNILYRITAGVSRGDDMRDWECPPNCKKMPTYGYECPDDLGPGEPCPLGMFIDETPKKGVHKMQKPANWDTTQAFTGEFKNLPPGGHVCVIKKAAVTTSQSGREMMCIYFDIAEGDSKDFYMEQYNRKITSNPDYKWPGVYRQLTEDNSLPYFKGMITSIEKSNPGYTWDWEEKSLKGKLFGGVFGQEEYESGDDIKLATKIRFIRSIDDIRNGKVEIPKIKTLEGDYVDPSTYKEQYSSQPEHSDYKEALPVDPDGLPAESPF